LKIDYLQFPVEHISQLMLLCVDTVIYLSYMYRDLLWSDQSGKSFRSTHMANWMFVQCYSFEPLRSIQIYTHIYTSSWQTCKLLALCIKLLDCYT